MSNNKIKFKKLKTTASEHVLKRKYDETRALMDDLKRGKKTDEELDKELAQQRKMARLAALQEMRNQQSIDKGSREDSAEALSRASHQVAGGSINNSINVSINVNVNQSTDFTNRRRKTTSKTKKTQKQREKDVMNTSLSKMLDQQLLMSNSPGDKTLTRNINQNVNDSLTDKIFHGDKIYLQKGAMAFKPLGMETVLESIDENQKSHHDWKKKMQTQAQSYSKSNRLAPQTTEQNIALQHQLDFASAEDFISFPSRKASLGLEVKDDMSKTPAQNRVSRVQREPESKSYSAQPQSSMNLIGTRRPSKDSVAVLPKRGLQKTASKSSLKQSPTKRMVPEEYRQVHPGLLQMEQRMLAKSLGTVTPINEQSQELNSMYSHAEGLAVRMQMVNQTPQAQPTVKFDRSSARRNVISQLSKSSKSNSSGGDTISRPRDSERVGANPENPGLLNQKTGNLRDHSRQLRKERYDQINVIDTDTVMAEKPDPPMPQRMRSNATFQPKSQKIEPSLSIENVNKVHDDNISQLAMNYGMHQQNKQRIINLMALLGKGGDFKKIDTDIEIGDSMSQAGGAGDNQSVLSKRSKLPNVGMRIQDNLTDEPVSTEYGTNVRGSIKNLAQFTKRRQTDEPSQQTRLGSQMLNKAPALDSSIGDTHSMRGVDINRSLLNQSVDVQSDTERSKLSQADSQLHKFKGGSLTKQNHQVEGLTNVHFLNKKYDLSYQIANPRDQSFGKDVIEQSERIRNLMKSTAGSQNRLHGVPKKPKKFEMVRSSMFNKNPIFDAMDVRMMSEIDRGSEISAGMHSAMTRPQPAPAGDYYSSLGDQLQRRPNDDNQSVRTLNVRSLSNQKLKPINYVRSSKDKTLEKNANRAQSLQFNQGLSYVMIKGKVQPSEKYIFKNMLPYTNAQQYQSVQIKSSVNRHHLVLQQNQPIPTSGQTTLTSNGKTIEGGGRLNLKSKKLKGGNKMKSSSLNNTKTMHKKSSTAVVDSSNLSQSIKRKGVIMEMEEEYSGSEAGTHYTIPSHKQATWQDIQKENLALKTQINNQIAIFEQYLKVATLQHKARVQAEKDAAKKGLIRKTSLDDQIFKGATDFEFDNKKEKQQFLKANAKRGKTNPVKKDYVSQSLSTTKKVTQVINRQKDHAYSGRQSSAASMNRVKSAKSIKSRKSAHKKTRQGSPSRASINKNAIATGKLRNVRLTRNNSQASDDSVDYEGRSRSPSKITAQFKILSKQAVSPSKMRAYEHLMPSIGMEKETHDASHIAHQIWMDRIQKLWRRLNRHRNQEVTRIQNEIKKNKQHINQLTRDNLFELDVNHHDQHLLLFVADKRTKVDRRLKYSREQKKIQELQSKIRDEIGKKQDFDTWGFHNHIIEYRVKVRVTEDVIDCAQRLQVKADEKTQRELNLLTMLRDRTYDDVKYFIEKREEKPWRHWDKNGFYYKPSIENRGLNYNQLKERIEVHLLIIAFIEPKYAQLVHDIPPYNALNSEMIQFSTECFGNEGWLQMFQLKQLRKQQEDEQHDKQYMPPVDHIKKLEVDPYTLQIESVDEASQADDLAEDAIESPAKQQPSVWKIRKPEKPTQGTLKTGYEPIIAQRQQIQELGDLNKQSIQLNIQQVDYSDEEIDDNKDSAGKKHIGGRTQSMITDLVERTPIGAISRRSQEDPGQIFGAKSLADRRQSQLTEVSGYGINKYEGDVVQHLKDKVADQDRKDEQDQEITQVKKSSWLQTLAKEKAAKAERDEADRKARAARLAILFEEEDVLSGDDEDLLDAGAAKQDVQTYIEKIDTHLQVEKRLLEAWHDNDEEERNANEGGPPK